MSVGSALSQTETNIEVVIVDDYSTDNTLELARDIARADDRVRVLEYADQPGDRTTPHAHPDSVMITLAGFRRRHRS